MLQFIIFFISVAFFCFAAAVAVELIRDLSEWHEDDDENNEDDNGKTTD